MRAALEMLELGYRFCVSDGRLSIDPGEPEWKCRCEPCFRDKIPAKHCTHCGCFIEDHIRNFMRDRNREARSCYACSHGKLGGRKALMKQLREKRLP